jgi:hypothetical protein
MCSTFGHFTAAAANSIADIMHHDGRHHQVQKSCAVALAMGGEENWSFDGILSSPKTAEMDYDTCDKCLMPVSTWKESSRWADYGASRAA